MYFRIAGASNRFSVDWPLNIAMKPQIAYRGIYMLPIWSAYDSLDSWKRVLLFNSELTLNRVWFWLDGFPVAGAGRRPRGVQRVRAQGIAAHARRQGHALELRDADHQERSGVGADARSWAMMRA